MLWLLACTGDPEDTQVPSDSSSHDTEQPTDSAPPDSPTDTQPDSDPPDTGDSGDTAPEPEPHPFSAYDYSPVVELSRDPGSYDWGAYTVVTYEVGTDFELAMPTPDGTLPRFRVIRPETWAPHATYPLFLYLHGSSHDDDSTVAKGTDGRCTQEWAASAADSAMRDSAMAHFVLDAGGVVVAPENVFCDGWSGLGPDDPVDTGHAGYTLAEVALGYVRWGPDAPATGPIYGFGTSLGAMGLVLWAAQTAEVEAIVADSGPADTLRFYYEDDYSGVELATLVARYDHTHGGPPCETEACKVRTDAYWRYRDMALNLALQEGSLTVPVLHLWNQQDYLSPPQQHQDTPGVLEETHGAADIRSFDYDVDHVTPAHTQVNSTSAAYAAWMGLRFLYGQELVVLEGEDFDGVGAAQRDDSACRNAVRRAEAGEAGTLLSHSFTPPAGEVSVRAWLKTGQDVSGDTEVVTLTLSEGGTVLAEASVDPDHGDWNAAAWQSVKDALDASTLAATSSGGELTLEVETTGATWVTLDVVVVDHAP